MDILRSTSKRAEMRGLYAEAATAGIVSTARMTCHWSVSDEQEYKRHSPICHESQVRFKKNLMLSLNRDLEKHLIVGYMQWKEPRGRIPARWSISIIAARGKTLQGN